MRIKPEQLASALQKKLAPIYFISGDEPLQLFEAADSIRTAAKKAGFTSREIFDADSRFSWHSLMESANSLSIFSDKKIIDLRLTTGAPNSEGAKIISQYCEQPPEDTLLLITAGKISGSSSKARWFQALDKAGCIIQVWPLENKELKQWLQQRSQRRGLTINQAGINLLANRIEGNLLAAAQEIEKLYVLFGTSQISAQQLEETVADHSRFDVFKLIDSILAAQTDRIIKILSNLKAEGIAEPVILWAIAREARTLIQIKLALAQGQNKTMVFKNHQIWDKRQSLVDNAINKLSITHLHQILKLAAQIDRQIKGQQSGDPWHTLQIICLRFAHAPGINLLDHPIDSTKH